MAKSQKQFSGIEEEFPLDVPWSELWQLANEIKDVEAQQVFCEAIWCLRAGGFRAAGVFGWVAIATYIGKVIERLPLLIRNIFLPPSSLSKDGKRILVMSRELTLFGMNAQTTVPLYTHLENLLNFRDKSAHTPISEINRSQRQKMIDELRLCVKAILVHPIDSFTFGEGPGVVLNLAKHPKIERTLDPNEAGQIVEFVTADQLPALAADLLNSYLIYDLYPDQNIHDVPDEAGKGSDLETVEIPTQDAQFTITYTNLFRLWNQTYRKLDDQNRIALLNVLKDEFADAVYCYAEGSEDIFSLREIGEGERRARGRRKLSELADLEVWQKEASPEKYRQLFYGCFAMNPGELFSLNSGTKRSLIEHAPEAHKHTLQLAFQEFTE